MSDYTYLGLTPKLRKENSLSTKIIEDTSALKQDLSIEKTPYLNPTSVFRGQMMAPGGTFSITDTTGQIIYFSVDPNTGLVTLNLPIQLNGVVTAGTSIFSGPTAFNSPGTVNNTSLAFAGGTTDGTAAIRMYNSGGTERITWGIDSTGFGYGTVDEVRFKGNSDNKLRESFGVVAQLADTNGQHAFRVQDSNGLERFALTSRGFMEIKGTMADPGGADAGVVRLFVQNNGGTDQLRAEFTTGTSVIIASNP